MKRKDTDRIKLGSSTSIKIKDYSVEYGTINKFPCKGIFVQSFAYVHPTTSYKKDIDKFKHNFEREMNSYIKNLFQGLKTNIIYSIEDRNTSIYNEEKFSILPIEITVLFNNEIDYKLNKPNYVLILNKMIDYFNKYEGLLFSNKNYK